jgi:hypothetical protein
VLDEAAREEVEEEFGLEFETGSEVESGDAGEGPAEPAEPEPEPEFDPVESEPEADTTAEPAGSEPEPEFDPIEPEPEEEEPEPESEPEFEPTVTDDSESGEHPEPEADPEPAEGPPEEPDDGAEPADDRPLDEVLIDRMESLDEGSGAPREELIAAVTEATGADEAAVETAIEDALMSGRCYEPDEGRYASI